MAGHPLERIRGPLSDQGHNGPKDQGTGSVCIRAHPWLPPAGRYGSASRSPELGTEGREVRNGLPPFPHPRQKPRSDSETPSAVELTSLSGANSPGYIKPLPFSCPFVSIRGSPAGKGPKAQRTKGSRDRIRVNPRPSVVATSRSDTGAHHEPHRLEQKHGKFGKAYRRFLIRDIREIRG